MPIEPSKQPRNFNPDALLVIQQSWDGISLPPKDWVSFSLNYLENGDLEIQISAPFYDDPPPKGAPIGKKGSFWGLWEYEVAEIFLVGEDGHYTELEFSPHGYYLTLRLDAPRSVIAKEEPLQYSAKILGQTWKGHSIVPQNLLPSTIHRVNCFAIHGQNESRRYLCYSPLPHDKPDFHQPDRFPLFSKDTL